MTGPNVKSKRMDFCARTFKTLQKWTSWNFSNHLPALRHYQRRKAHPRKLDRALETETPGMTGFCPRLCFLVDESEELGLRLIPSSWKCLCRAGFVQPEHPEPRERANFAANGDRLKINQRLICTAPTEGRS